MVSFARVGNQRRIGVVETMSIAVITGSTDESIRVWAYNSAGVAITGEAHNSAGIAASVVVRSKGRIVSTTALTLVARSGAGVHTDSAFTEVGSGEYVIDLADSYFATANRDISVTLTSTAITGGYVLSQTLAVGKAAELDAAARSALLLAMVTEDTGETAAADGSPAKLAQGGVSTANILPAVGIVASRSPGVTLLPVVGETISQSITVYETDGITAVDLSGKTLAIVFETMSGVDIAVVDNSDITVSGSGSNVVTFAYPSAVTATERVLRFALRDAAAPLTMYLQGVCSVVSAPKVD